MAVGLRGGGLNFAGPTMYTLSNAARAMIESTIERIHARNGGQGDEDLASALRQQEAIETEIRQLENLIAAAQKRLC